MALTKYDKRVREIDRTKEKLERLERNHEVITLEENHAEDVEKYSMKYFKYQAGNDDFYYYWIKRIKDSLNFNCVTVKKLFTDDGLVYSVDLESSVTTNFLDMDCTEEIEQREYLNVLQGMVNRATGVKS